MAKGYAETDSQCRDILKDIRNGKFAPVYLLMGEEPYYVDLLCDAIVSEALDDGERDFNQTIVYGADADPDSIVTAARRFPMFASRQLVVIKEAQMMKKLEDISVYCGRPLDTTVLVIAMHGANADKRRSLYKTVQKIGVVFESVPVRDYEISRWIADFYKRKGLEIAPDAAVLLGEYAGTDLSRISIETDKMLKNLPEGTTRISVADIERNVGISRQYSIFELTKELSARNSVKAMKIAAYIAASPRFAMPMAIAPLHTHFYRILKYGALLMKDKNPQQDKKIKILGVNPYFFREYDMAVMNFPVRKCMAVISLLKDYDYKGKGGDSGEASQSELMMELITKILNI